MKKDNYGVCLTFYAVLAFVLTMLGHTTLNFLLLGFVIVVHKEQWLIRQVMQAFFLSLLSGVLLEVISVLNVFNRIPFVGAMIAGILGFISSLISVIVFILAIVGILKVSKGEDANLPLLKTFAEKAFGIVKKVTYVQETGTED